MTIDVDRYYSTDEVRALVGHLSDGDIGKAQRMTRYTALKMPAWESGEVLNEIFLRILDGTRRWPRHLSFLHFFSKVLKSMLSNDAKHNQFAQGFDSGLEVDNSGSLTSYSSEAVSSLEDLIDDPSETRHCEEMLDALANALKDDQTALVVALATAHGYSMKEIRAQYSLSAKEADAARKRYSRAVTKLKAEVANV